MNLFYIKKTLCMHLFICLLCFFFYLSNNANAEVSGKNALNSSAGSLLGHLGLGVATSGDSSIVDINPALLAAIEKQYSLFGNLNFYNGFSLYEVGLIDTIFAPVAALLKARQTTNDTTEIDRRIELALAYRFPETNFSLGVTGNYEQYGLKHWKHQKESGTNFAIGGLYQINYQTSQPLFIGASATNLFDKFQKASYNLGISKGFLKELYRLHLDGSIVNFTRSAKMACGIDLTFKRYFILSGSVGFNFETKVVPLGGTIYFNGPRLKTFYSLATHQANMPGLWQSTGLVLTF